MDLLLAQIEAIASDGGVEQLPKVLWALPASETELQGETMDIDLALDAYAKPRALLAVQMWHRRTELSARRAHLPLLARVATALKRDYAALRRRLVGPHAAGFGRMSRVQRGVFYLIWLARLTTGAVERYARDICERQQVPLTELTAADYDYALVMEARAHHPVAVMGATRPIGAYSLWHLHTALAALTRCMWTHGVPRDDDAGGGDGATSLLPSLVDYWDALWTRVAQIVGAGDLTPAEKASSTMFGMPLGDEPADACTDGDVLHGRLPVELPHVAGGQRLRLAGLERLEVIFWAGERSLESLATFEAAAAASSGARVARRLRECMSLPTGVGVGGDGGHVPLGQAWLAMLERVHRRMGPTVNRYNREELAAGISRVHVWPGENELYYLQTLEHDQDAPPLEVPPSADDVIFRFRSDEYEHMAAYHQRPSPHDRARQAWIEFPADPTHLAAAETERLGLLWVLTALDADVIYTGLIGAHQRPGLALYLAELDQWQATGTVAPPASPADALLRACRQTAMQGRPGGLRATVVRILRRSFLVVPMPAAPAGADAPAAATGDAIPCLVLDLSDPTGTGTTPLDLCATLTAWLGMCDPGIYTADGVVPAELRPFVNAVRRGHA